MPLFEAEFTATLAELPAAGRICGLIATSANALRIIPAGQPLPPGLSAIPVYVVGAATAKAARIAGFTDIRLGGGDGEDLARLVLAEGIWRSSTGRARRRLIYLAGTPRRPALEQLLKQGSAPLDVLTCYRMKEISYSTDKNLDDLRRSNPDAVLLYSANAANRLGELARAETLAKSLESCRFVCLSDAVAAALPADFRERAVIAAQPNEDSLLASLAALE